MTQTVSLVIKWSDHYEVHYPDHVEFWSLDRQTKLGESPVETVN